MKISYIMLIALVSCSLALPSCEPLWPRMFYGKSIKDPSSSDKLSSYFNTREACSNSYVQIITKNGMNRVTCQTTAISLSEHTNFYRTYVQKCHTDAIKYDETFFYNVFGRDDLLNYGISYGDYIEARLANPFDVLLYFI